MSDLSGRIMNIQTRHEKIMAVKDKLTGFEEFDTIVQVAYKMGHRDARHEAAEMAEAPDPRLEVAREALERIEWANVEYDHMGNETYRPFQSAMARDALAKIKGEE